MDIYRQEIIDHYQNPRNYGSLEKKSVAHEEANSFCGDRIRMEVLISGDQIKDVAFSGEGCAISVASASFLTEMIKGQPVDKIKKISQNDIIKRIGLKLSPTRLKCALLPVEVLQKALKAFKSPK